MISVYLTVDNVNWTVGLILGRRSQYCLKIIILSRKRIISRIHAGRPTFPEFQSKTFVFEIFLVKVSPKMDRKCKLRERKNIFEIFFELCTLWMYLLRNRLRQNIFQNSTAKLRFWSITRWYKCFNMISSGGLISRPLAQVSNSLITYTT